MNLRILDVGQCGVDGPTMASLWQRELGAEVVSVDTAADAVEEMDSKPFDLILVNRVLAADGGSGLDAIRQIREADGMVPVMLVSDHADAQEEARALGAKPGFGKSELSDPKTLEKIRAATKRRTS